MAVKSCVPPAFPLAGAAAAVDAADGKTNPSAPPPQEHTARATVSTKPVALLAVAVVAAAIICCGAPAGTLTYANAQCMTRAVACDFYSFLRYSQPLELLSL